MSTTTRVLLIKRPRVLPADRPRYERVLADAIAAGTDEKGARAKALKATVTHYWVLRWSGTDGKGRSESLGRVDEINKRDAQEKRREKELALGTGKAMRDKPKRMTLGEFLQADHDSIQADIRGSTLIEHGLSSKHAKNAIGADVELSKIGWPEVGMLKKYLADKGRSQATIKKTLCTMRAAFNRAVKQGLILKNPFAELAMPRTESRPKRIFTRSEFDAMVKVAGDTWWKAFITLAAMTGMRLNELLNLQWRDVDLDKKVVKVQPKRSERFTVGKRELRTWNWNPKAKASIRSIPLGEEAADQLKRMKIRMGASPFVFVDAKRLTALQRLISDAGELPLKCELINNMNRRFDVVQDHAKAALAKLSKSKQYDWPHGCIHDMRRTYCTWLAEAGVPMHVLRQYAGHSDIATTASFYLSVSDDMAERARKALSAAG